MLESTSAFLLKLNDQITNKINEQANVKLATSQEPKKRERDHEPSEDSLPAKRIKTAVRKHRATGCPRGSNQTGKKRGKYKKTGLSLKQKAELATLQRRQNLMDEKNTTNPPTPVVVQ